MKIIAIDYGIKQIGIAVSNKKGTLAFPYKTLPNNPSFLSTLKKIIAQESIAKVVVGVPRYNPRTPLYYEIEGFINKLKSCIEIPVDVCDELLTSQLVKRLNQPAKNKQKNSHDIAAMIILESYINKCPLY